MRNRKNVLLYQKKPLRKLQIGGWSPSMSDEQSGYNDAALYGNGTGQFSNSARARAGVPNVSAVTTSARPFGSYGTDMKAPSLSVPEMPKFNGASVAPSVSATQGLTAASTLKPVGLQNTTIPKPVQVDTGLGKAATAAKGTGSGMSAGTTGAISAVAGMAGSYVETLGDDKKDTTYTKKEKAASIGGSTLKGAATGMSLGSVVPGIGTLIGAAAGAVIGAISGILKNKKAAKNAKNALAAENVALNSAQSAKARSEAANRDSYLSTGVPSTISARSAGETPAGGYNSLALRRNGGTFHYTLKKNFNREIVVEPVIEEVPVFKKGGSIKPTENIIPNGVLHEEENSLGDKGMPVVHCKNNSCKKKYEIERDELIFTLAATKKTEDLVKSGNLKELGSFVKTQLLDNTHSFTDKYKELNNRGVENGTIHT